MRNMIWELLLPGPRNVKILPTKRLWVASVIGPEDPDWELLTEDSQRRHMKIHEENGAWLSKTREELELCSDSVAPIGLLISQESRNFTLKYFKEIFSHSNRQGNRAIYINTAIDMVFFSLSCFDYNFEATTTAEDRAEFEEIHIHANGSEGISIEGTSYWDPTGGRILYLTSRWNPMSDEKKKMAKVTRLFPQLQRMVIVENIDSHVSVEGFLEHGPSMWRSPDVPAGEAIDASIEIVHKYDEMEYEDLPYCSG